MYKQMQEPTEMQKVSKEPNIFRKAVTIMNESCLLRGLTESVARRLIADGDKQIRYTDESMPEMYSLEQHLDQTIAELESLHNTLDIIIDSLAQ